VAGLQNASERNSIARDNMIHAVRTDPKIVGSRLQSGVLCVDLDGTLLKTDSLYEILVKVVTARPGIIFSLPFWLARGRIHLKEALAREVHRELDPALWPRRAEVEMLVAEAKSRGKTVELISGADRLLICNHSPFPEMFHTVIGSSDGLNLTGKAKADFLRKRHPQGFAYVGNSAADLPVWHVAAECFAVNLSSSLRGRAAREGLDLVELTRAGPVIPALFKSMRLHQWLKNLLVFVPLALMAPRANLSDFVTFVSGFLIFGLLTSGTYLINDILDIEADRRHPSKLRRPIAIGDLSLPIASASAALLIGISLICSLFLSRPFAFTLIAYLILTLAYSFRLKRIPLIDVLVIASLFTMRIVAGITLVSQPPSEWLLLFSAFFFFGLALMKREVELSLVGQTGAKVLQGRGYALEDRTLLMCFGVSSGVASIVVFALFVSSMVEQSASPYVSPQWLWGAMAVLSYWMMRMWLLTIRGQMNDDPILYAASDRASLIMAALVAVFVLAAQLVRI
jgi:4-hydroxybenzoate polyprenyltransferase/phosphoserine phosphatase